MRVRAARTGFDGKRRIREGEVFEHDGALASWMEPVEEEAPKPRRKKEVETVMDQDVI